MVNNGTEAAWLGALLLVLMLCAVGVFDIYALYSGGRVATISSVIQGLSKDYPLLPFALGLVIGHLFFPTFTVLRPPAP